jgi:hypothetical protein
LFTTWKTENREIVGDRDGNESGGERKEPRIKYTVQGQAPVICSSN